MKRIITEEENEDALNREQMEGDPTMDMAGGNPLGASTASKASIYFDAYTGMDKLDEKVEEQNKKELKVQHRKTGRVVQEGTISRPVSIMHKEMTHTDIVSGTGADGGTETNMGARTSGGLVNIPPSVSGVGIQNATNPSNLSNDNSRNQSMQEVALEKKRESTQTYPKRKPPPQHAVQSKGCCSGCTIF